MSYSSALTAAENKIPSVSNLDKKTDCNTKINKVLKKITDHNHDKFFTTPEFNKFTAETFASRLKQANLESKSDITNFVNKAGFDTKLKDVTSYKNELNELLKKVNATSTKGLTKDFIDKFSILNGAKNSSSGIFQYIKYLTGTTRIESWKSKRMLEESIENITKSDSNFPPTLVDHLLLPDMSFNERCLIKK